MDNWAWLEEIEKRVAEKRNTYMMSMNNEYFEAERLIACIKEMRNFVEYIGQGNLNPKLSNTVTWLWEDKARETLNRCAKGKFDSTAGRTLKEDV